MILRAVVLACAVCTLAEGQTVLLSDDFARDSSFNQTLWAVNTPLVKFIATSAFPMNLVDPGLSFSPVGMKISGASAKQQFTGMQSRQSFTAPYTVQATVMAVAASANVFSLCVTSDRGGQVINLNGNLNPDNGGNYRTALTATGTPLRLLDPRPELSKWYTLTIAVDRFGTASASVADESGRIIGETGGISFYTGPVYVMLSQNEVNPRSLGPNVAVWRSVSVRRPDADLVSSTREAPRLPDPSSGNGRPPLFREPMSPSSAPLPSKQFDLNGTWSFEDGTVSGNVLIQQRNGEIRFTSLRENKLIFNGRYENNPVITGERLAWTAADRVIAWRASTITVMDPDHLRDDGFENKILNRLSNPSRRDVACDDQNTNHVIDYYAWLRGKMAAAEEDYRTARCWLMVGAKLGHGPAESMLAALIVDGKGSGSADSGADYVIAFDLLSRRVPQAEDPKDELLLAEAYRRGLGTQADQQKADYWLARGQEQQWIDQAAGASGGGLLDWLFGDTASIQSRIAAVNGGCYGRKSNSECDAQDSALQADLEAARARNRKTVGELQEIARRLRKDCSDRYRGACQEFEAVNDRVQELGGGPVR